MTPARARVRYRRPSLGRAFLLSLVLHVALAGALLAARPSAVRVLPPSFRVDLVAAPPATEPATEPAPAAARPAPPPKAMPSPMPAAPKRPPKTAPAPARPVPPSPAPAQPAEPGRGSDVATVRTEGAEFPYPAYLENIVRVIALRFKPPRNTAAHAEVVFVIQRDGSIKPNSLRFLSPSGDFAFDLEAQGAVEQAGDVKAFGPLPSGYTDDVLPVVFSFDPRILH